MNYCKLSLLAFALVAIFSCKNDKKEKEMVEDPATETTTETTKTVVAGSAEFNDAEVAMIFQQYLKLKDALVETDAEAASKQADNLMTAFANEGVQEELLMAAQKIQEANDIETQRAQFVNVTEGLEELLQGAIAGGQVYKQFCPMAFNNEGAYWLSDSEEIRNPYFGDKMLKCGKVTAEIK